MANPASLFGNPKSDGFGGLSEILGLLLEFKDSGGKVSEMKGKTAPAAAPSAAPVGQPTATAGVDIQKAPKPPGAPEASGVDESRFSLGDNVSLKTAPTGGGTQPTGGGPQTNPTGSPDSGGGIMDAIGGGGFGTFTTAGAAIGGPWGAGIGAAADIGLAIADVASKEDTTWADRLNEQAFKIRQTFKVGYEDYFLPMQIDAKQYAAGQMGKNTPDYEYARTALKGYIEGYSGVMGGQKEWDDVWNDIGGDLEALEAPNETWMDFYEDNYENAQPNVVVQEMVYTVMSEVLGDTWLSQLGLSPTFWKNVAGEIAKMGGAMIGASKDMRNNNTGDMYRGSI